MYKQVTSEERPNWTIGHYFESDDSHSNATNKISNFMLRPCGFSKGDISKFFHLKSWCESEFRLCVYFLRSTSRDLLDKTTHICNNKDMI